MSQPAGAAYLCGGVYVKEMLTPKAGTIIPQHRHHYEHLSYVAAGAVEVWKDDAFMGVFEAPAGIKIEAGAAHTFTTLRDWTLVLCIHSVALGEADFHEGDLVSGEHQLKMEG